MNIFVADIAFALANGAVISLAATSFTVQYAVSGVVNLATGEFMTVAAYLVYTAEHTAHIGIWPASLMAILVTGLLGVILNRYLLAPLKRRGVDGHGLMIVTFAVSLAVQNLLVIIYGPGSFALPFGGQYLVLSIGSFRLTAAQLITIVIAVVALGAFEALLHATRVGRTMRAVVDSPTLARASGISLGPVSDLAWFIAGAFGGVAGLALSVATGNVDATLGSLYLLYLLPAAFFGGVGSVSGAMIGALVIAFVTTWGGVLIGPQYENALALAALLITIMFRPSGIMARSGVGMGEMKAA